MEHFNSTTTPTTHHKPRLSIKKEIELRVPRSRCVPLAYSYYSPRLQGVDRTSGVTQTTRGAVNQIVGTLNKVLIPSLGGLACKPGLRSKPSSAGVLVSTDLPLDFSL